MTGLTDRDGDIVWRGKMRRSSLLWLGAALAGAGAILFLPLAPLPPSDNVAVGSDSLYATGFAAAWNLAAPETAAFRVIARVRGGKEVASARVNLAAQGGPSLLDTTIDVRGPAFQSVLLGADLHLSRDLSYLVSLEETKPPFGIDFIEIQPSGGAPLRLEVENARLSGHKCVVVDTEASGGTWIGSVPRSESEHFVQTFRGRASVMDGLSLNIGFPSDPRSGVAIFLDDISAGRRVFELSSPAGFLPWKGPFVRLRFPPTPALGHDFRITLDRKGDAFAEMPLSEANSGPDEQLLVNDLRLAASLLFVPRYRLPWRPMAYAGAAVAFVLAGAGFRRRSGRDTTAALIIVSLAALSMAYWQRDYQFVGASHWIADGYDEYADHFQALLRGSPGAAARLHAYATGYPHAHSPLVPALVAVFSFGASTVRTYLLLSYLAALATAAVLAGLLNEIPDLPKTVSWALWCIGVTHFLFVRIITRTSTDGFGYMFTVMALLFAMRLARSDVWRGRDLATLVLVLTLGMFSRPTVVPAAPALASGLLVVSWFRSRLGWQTVAGACLVAIVPLLAFFGGIRALGLWRTFSIAHSEMALFSDGRTTARLLVCLGVLVQLLAIPLLLGLREEFRRPEVIVGLSWAGASIAFVVLAGTYWNRHFAAALPGLLVAASPGASALFDRYPRVARAGVLGCAGVNLGLLCINLARDVGFGGAYLFQ